MPQGYVRALDLPQVIPVFPLGGAILLPRGQLPLNIFEPRYLNMVDDAMAGDRIIGLIQPKGGTPALPGLSSVGCAGRLTQIAETGDGRYVITLTGIARFRIEQELSVLTPYRQCRIDFGTFAGDFAPRAAVTLLAKDLGLALDTGTDALTALPLASVSPMTMVRISSTTASAGAVSVENSRRRAAFDLQLDGNDLELDGIPIAARVVPMRQVIETVVDHLQRSAQVLLPALTTRQVGEIGGQARAVCRLVVLIEPNALEAEREGVAHDGAAAVEAEPTEPKQSGAREGQHEAVWMDGLLGVADPFAENQDRGKSRRSGRDVHDCSTGEVQGSHFAEQADG